MAILTVTTANDIVDAGDGLTSLREAVTSANATAGADTIVFDAALAGSTLVLTGGELALTQDVIIDGDIDGDDKADVTLSGNDASRIFNITGAGTDANLFSLKIIDGFTAAGINGGAVYAGSSTSLNVSDATFDGSNSGGNGGAIFTQGSSVTIDSSLFFDNFASASGGAMRFHNTSTVTLNNSTIVGNSADSRGGGIEVSGSSILNAYNSTIYFNLADADETAANQGGGISDNSGTVNLFNTVVAKNFSSGFVAEDDVRGTIDSASHSFIGTLETITTNTNTVNGGGDPLVAGLDDHGGTTETIDLSSASPLINAGNSADAPAGTDADGNARTVFGQTDIGATEFQAIVTAFGDEAAGASLALDLADGTGLSLREAVFWAGAGDTITFDAALAGSTLVLTGGEITIDKDLIIDGDIDDDNKADITISGNNADRIFNLTGATTDVDLDSLTLTAGRGSSSSAPSGGGAILAGNISSLDITDTTISNSYAYYGGGALTAVGTTVSLNNVLVTGNSGYYGGGGLAFFGSSVATLTNTTVYDNQTSYEGGGIIASASSTLTLNNSTVTDNTAFDFGGGIVASGLVLNNSVVSGSTISGGVADDISGSIAIANNSFIGTTETILASSNNINGGGDAGLLLLADNGGPTQTIRLADDSALIAAGDASLLPADVNDIDNDGDTAEALPVDANGDTRVIGKLDIGAVESSILIVDNAIDEDDGDFSAGDLSLREAVALAGVGDTIRFDESLSGQTLSVNFNISDIELVQSVVIDGDIDGDNKADITLTGNDRIFSISGAATDVDLLSLNFDGAYFFGGAAVIVGTGFSSLDVVDSTFSNNRHGAVSLSGGGITNIINSTFTENFSFYSGGAISISGGHTLNLTNSTIDSNSAEVFGGGISVSSATLNVFNSTITNNAADSIFGNGVPGFGGGISNNNGTVNLTNSVVAGNTTGVGATLAFDDVRGTINIAAYSFIGTYEVVTVNAGAIIGGGDPLLGELLDNGGTTLTSSPLDGSALIDAGSIADIPLDIFDLDGDGNTAEALPIDGRGGLRIIGGTVDIGAVEQIVDEVIGGTAGDDNIVGGLGNDTATYKDASAGVTQYLLFTGLDTGGAGTDTLSGIENLTGSEFVDRLAGDGGDNILTGNGGDDVLKGKGGNDTFHGGDGDDKLTGGAGDDTMFGGDGNDTLIALAGLDVLNGGKGDDFLFGGKDNDTLNGNFGADNIRGNLGIDVLNGGANNDTLRGGGQNDTLNGDTGDDFLFGENHFDTLFGGAGNDSLTGGAGGGIMDGFTDTFVYKDTGDGGGGFDRIKDFENGIDVMDLQSFEFADFAAVQAISSNSGVNMRINFGGGDVLFVENFQLADFDVGDVLI